MNAEYHPNRGALVRIAVTGARGRVGRELVAALDAEGHEVLALDILPTRGDMGSSVTQRVVGLGDSGALASELAGIDVVAHLAAFMSWRAGDAERVFDANATGTFHLLRAAATADVQRVVFASTGEVYPENKPQYVPLDEDHPTLPATVYGLTKLIGEQMVEFFARTTEMETVILRFSHTQDAAELLDETSPFSGPRFFLKRRIEQQVSAGNDAAVAALMAADHGGTQLVVARGEDGTSYRMGICDTRDLVAGIVLAITQPDAAGQVFGIGPDEATSMDQIVPAMAEMTGLPFVDVRLPGAAVNYETSNQKARDVLGFRPHWPTTSMLDEAHKLWRSRQRNTSVSTTTNGK